MSNEQTIEQHGADLDEARRWVRDRIEGGISLPPLEVAYMAGLRNGLARGERQAALRISDLLDTQAEMWAPPQAADWLRGMAKVIRREVEATP